MSEISCTTCPFHSLHRGGDGIEDQSIIYCHHESAPCTETDSDWWCSEHPLAPGQRDRIAEMAMQGMLTLWADRYPEKIATDAYAQADAMMAERAKGKP